MKQICFNKALSHFGLAVKRPKFDGILVGGNHKSMGSRWCFKIHPELIQPGADPHYCKPSVLWLNPTGILGEFGRLTVEVFCDIDPGHIPSHNNS